MRVAERGGGAGAQPQRFAPTACSARSGVPPKSRWTRAWRWRSFPGFSPKDSACSFAGVRRSTCRSSICSTCRRRHRVHRPRFRNAVSGHVPRQRRDPLQTPDDAHAPATGRWQLGPALAAGLTLRFYESFQVCRTLPALKERIAAETPEYDRWGIHVLVSQTAGRELTIGDSHEYGAAVDPFDRAEIDDLILRYARGFLQRPIWRSRSTGMASTRNIRTSHSSRSRRRPMCAWSRPPAASGMTLSFGLAEETVKEMGF